jgi:signal transduction histidine kinase
MNSLWEYLRSRRLAIGGTIGLFIIAACTWWLEELPAIALLDLCLFSAVLLIPLITADFLRWRRRLQLLHTLSAAEATQLSPSPDATLVAYQQLLTKAVAGQKTAEEAAKAQTHAFNEHFGLWSHQMKTPLAALDLLLQVKPVDTTAARGEVRSIERYVRMMLTYVKMADVNTDLVLQKLALLPLVQQQLRQLAPLFIGKNLAVRVDELPQVVGDSQWLSFILEQILTNAAKYTKTGNVHVYWDGDSLAVTDTGMGIMASDLPRLFDPGFSGYNGRYNQKASGLGLYMSQTIAHKMGLNITVDSTLGHGTTVRLHFAQQEWHSE